MFPNQKKPVYHGHPIRYYILRVEIKLSVIGLVSWLVCVIFGTNLMGTRYDKSQRQMTQTNQLTNPITLSFISTRKI